MIGLPMAPAERAEQLTGRESLSFSSISTFASSATQLVLYSELAKSFAGAKPIRLQFGVLTKTKEPSVAIHPVTCDVRQMARTWQIVERVWNAIQCEQFYPAPSALQCPGCPYRRACQAWPG